MKTTLFQNDDQKAIRILLKEIGRYRYDRELERQGFGDQKPLTMSGFYLEANESCTFLCYKYPSRIIVKIMRVDEFMQIPKEGWRRLG